MFCRFVPQIKPVLFALQRADSVRPALSSSAERHGAEQEDPEAFTQVIWRKTGHKVPLEAAWTGKCVWLGARLGRCSLYVHFTAALTLPGSQTPAGRSYRGLPGCFAFSSMEESALSRKRPCLFTSAQAPGHLGV